MGLSPFKPARQTWLSILIALPLAGGAAALQYYLHMHFPAARTPELAASLRPSSYRLNQGAQASGPKSATKTDGEDADLENGGLDGDDGLADNFDDPAGMLSEPEYEGGGKSKRIGPQIMYFETASQKELQELASEDDEERGLAQCARLEYRGDGPKRPSAADWDRVAKDFMQVRLRLLAWINHRHKEFPDKTLHYMREQMKAMQIESPPLEQEPDLNWRGIGIFTRSKDQVPTLRVGSGFVKLMRKNPARARFELARLASQAWAPCELHKVDNGETWLPFLKCMGSHQELSCGAGSYSEAGWAVSSALATVVAPAGCTVPAFVGIGPRRCLKKFPLPLTIGALSSPFRREVAGR